MAWFADIGNIKRSLVSESKKITLGLHHHHHHHQHHDFRQEKSSPPLPTMLGILGFETAKTMSRLVSLYKSLSDEEVHKLRKEVIRSVGVTYLNSKDEGFLLNLACTERLEELDRAAITVTRLGQKCSDFGLTQFDLVYTDLKLGIIDIGKLDYSSKNIEKIIEKMERYIGATSSLYSALESLTEMEMSEKKLSQWRKNLGPAQSQRTNFDLFDHKLAYQRKQVRHFYEVSLWNQTFDKSVGLMARIVCIVYARICIVFGPYMSGLPCFSPHQIRPHSLLKQQIPGYSDTYCFLDDRPKEKRTSKSGPMPKTSARTGFVRFGSRESNLLFSHDLGFRVAFGIGRNENKRTETRRNNKVFQAAPPSTVGGSGLALRYANVIILAERYLNAPVIMNDDARRELYHMLPESLKLAVRSKLRRSASNDEDQSLAEGWREAMEGILEWLAPMAHDTVRWQAESNFDKQKFDARPTVLLLQTLHFSDKEKTEAAIAELMVGLSCIYRYENRYYCGGGDGEYSYG
ncbi:hypothetical protein L1049_007810 [Liquidambar formosana]|uniref:Avr9/Cf-9 rapidly elicited protein 137 n=1 Tax=Liquidambar formosana TaxID=63359 RepID=A0AAP0S8E5_LIQFO